jgi:hypothetical protein
MRELTGAGIITYEIEVANRLVRVRLKGPVQPSEIEHFMLSIEDDQAYDLSFDGLVDLREFSGDVELEDIKRIAQLVRSRPGGSGARRAIIVKDDLQFGLMRMLEGFTFLAPVVYHAFRSEEAAVRWLAEKRGAAER